jgi:NAD(P)-dependent dehydrogenase (short-subunit alcohol dehydrogenase family)
MIETRYPSLAGRAVFISGGASGIGEAFVRAFAAQGAKVAFVDLDAQAGNDLAEALGRDGAQVFFQTCDVTDTATLRACLAGSEQRYGAVRVLLNNAASDVRHAVADVTPEFFDRAIAVNLRHQFFASQTVAPAMAAAGGGSIINLGSTSWMIKGSGYPIYATCKSAVHGLSRSLARELGPQGIRVNALVPGWVMTPRQLRLWVTPEAEAEIDAAQCMPGRVMADDIAAMALFLAADDSRMCTAQSFVVDGGWT